MVSLCEHSYLLVARWVVSMPFRTNHARTLWIHVSPLVLIGMQQSTNSLLKGFVYPRRRYLFGHKLSSAKYELTHNQTIVLGEMDTGLEQTTTRAACQLYISLDSINYIFCTYL